MLVRLVGLFLRYVRFVRETILCLESYNKLQNTTAKSQQFAEESTEPRHVNGHEVRDECPSQGHRRCARRTRRRAGRMPADVVVDLFDWLLVVHVDRRRQWHGVGAAAAASASSVAIACAIGECVVDFGWNCDRFACQVDVLVFDVLHARSVWTETGAGFFFVCVMVRAGSGAAAIVWLFCKLKKFGQFSIL